MAEGRDIWWHDIVDRQSTTSEPEQMESEDMLYLLYTSGTTAKPKGILHTTAGYLLGVPPPIAGCSIFKDDDIYWAAADIGWVTGHSYIVYGPLANGTTGVMYEGTPDFPQWERWWEIVERYKVTILYSAPTAIRAHMKQGPQYAAEARSFIAAAARDRSANRSIRKPGCGTTSYIGAERCPIVDTWWQTETGAIMISPLPSLTTTKPGSATFPLPGIEADIVDRHGNSVPLGRAATWSSDKPWPSMLRGIYGDPERYKATYWTRFPGSYFPGDGCKRDEDGYYWLMGRVDDVMNVSGHRLSTTEIESALVAHPKPSPRRRSSVSPTSCTGEAIFAFVILKASAEPSPELGAGAAQARRQQDRPDRPSEDGHVHAGPAENPLRQDHAPPAARHRHRPHPRRHHHPGRRRRGRNDPRRLRLSEAGRLTYLHQYNDPSRPI